MCIFKVNYKYFLTQDFMVPFHSLIQCFFVVVFFVYIALGVIEGASVILGNGGGNWIKWSGHEVIIFGKWR